MSTLTKKQSKRARETAHLEASCLSSVAGGEGGERGQMSSGKLVPIRVAANVFLRGLCVVDGFGHGVDTTTSLVRG
jgi:hypothetical protein